VESHPEQYLCHRSASARSRVVRHEVTRRAQIVLEAKKIFPNNWRGHAAFTIGVDMVAA
jgi:hypothetical protein